MNVYYVSDKDLYQELLFIFVNNKDSSKNKRDNGIIISKLISKKLNEKGYDFNFENDLYLYPPYVSLVKDYYFFKINIDKDDFNNVSILTNDFSDIQVDYESKNHKRFLLLDPKVKKEPIELETFDFEELFFLVYDRFVTCSYKLSNIVSDILDEALYLSDKKGYVYLHNKICQLAKYCYSNNHINFLNKSVVLLGEIYDSKVIFRDKLGLEIGNTVDAYDEYQEKD